jgi:hypothetical protein
MVTAVRMQVEGVDLNDEGTRDLVGRQFAHFLWASVDGLVTVTVYVEHGNVVGHATEAARSIEHAMDGAKVRRVHRDLVTQSDIATRVGVSREAVRKWTHRTGTQRFPAPLDTVGGGDTRAHKVWQWSDVVTWLRDVYMFDLDQDLPDDETVAHIDACLAKVNGYLDREWQTVSASPDAHMLGAAVEVWVLKGFEGRIPWPAHAARGGLLDVPAGRLCRVPRGGVWVVPEHETETVGG